MNDTIIAKILTVKADNYILSYHYREASDIYDTLIKQYPKVLDSAEIASYQNVQVLFGTLASVQPQRIHKQDDIEIAAYRNPFNHLMTPIKCGGITDEFIFDTGANLSTISDSCAKKMGLTIYQSDIEVGSSTGGSIQTQLAVADSLYVGNILFENVIFLVAPAEQMSFPSINYEIHGVIGFPVLHQMGEVHMQKDGEIIVPKEPKNKQLVNMYLDGLTPIVQVLSDRDTLLFNLDTGAKTSNLSKKYYDNHKTEIEQKSEQKTAQLGGAGGIVEVEQYLLQNFPYSIGTKSNVLPDISVMLSEQGVTKYFDGTVGQDIILQFNKMILNFQYMYVDFE
jgi:predicted aspartyl protease